MFFRAREHLKINTKIETEFTNITARSFVNSARKIKQSLTQKNGHCFVNVILLKAQMFHRFRISNRLYVSIIIMPSHRDAIAGGLILLQFRTRAENKKNIFLKKFA